MGQPITVVQKPTTRPGVVRFDLNRSLTGMGHERYRSGTEVTGHRPPDEVARRLFSVGGVEAVHIYSNEVTVELASGADPHAYLEPLQDLFIHYVEGVTPSIP